VYVRTHVLGDRKRSSERSKETEREKQAIQEQHTVHIFSTNSPVGRTEKVEVLIPVTAMPSSTMSARVISAKYDGTEMG
jgi:hypothetical protein